MTNMLVVSSPYIPGYHITKVFGLVRGNTVRARHLGRDILAAFRNLVGGEVTEYRKLMAESREQALDQMVEEAREMVTFISSNGWRRTSRTCFLYSGNSSKKRTPLWARLTSPGLGI